MMMNEGTIDEKIDDAAGLVRSHVYRAFDLACDGGKGAEGIQVLKDHLDRASRAVLRLESLLGEKAALEERERAETDREECRKALAYLGCMSKAWPPTDEMCVALRDALEIVERTRGER